MPCRPEYRVGCKARIFLLIQILLRAAYEFRRFIRAKILLRANALEEKLPV